MPQDFDRKLPHGEDPDLISTDAARDINNELLQDGEELQFPEDDDLGLHLPLTPIRQADGRMLISPITSPSLEITTSPQATDNPFQQEVVSGVRTESPWMGGEGRAPVWSDLAQMVSATSQWSSEYGLVTRKAEDGSISVGFIRGMSKAIENTNYLSHRGQKVFFHSHPDVDANANGLAAPLVSPGDLNATCHAWGGSEEGGYLNIVCHGGITMQIDSEPLKGGPTFGYTVETGPHKGTVIWPEGKRPDLDVMRKLLNSGKPFVYSAIAVPESRVPEKLLFAYIPWDRLDTAATSLENVCFGNGLQEILPPEFLQASRAPGNLYEALQKTFGREDTRLDQIDDSNLAAIWGSRDDEIH